MLNLETAWQHNSFRTNQPNMQPLHFEIIWTFAILTFWLPTLKTWCGNCTLLGHFDLWSWYYDLHLENFVHLLYFETIHVNCFNIFWEFSLTFWPLTLIWHICSGHSLETVYGNYTIFSGHSNLHWDLCNVDSFWHVDFCPWNYFNHWLRNLIRKFLFGPAENEGIIRNIVIVLKCHFLATLAFEWYVLYADEYSNLNGSYTSVHIKKCLSEIFIA